MEYAAKRARYIGQMSLGKARKEAEVRSGLGEAGRSWKVRYVRQGVNGPGPSVFAGARAWKDWDGMAAAKNDGNTSCHGQSLHRQIG